jgi:hypothetical protein
MEASGYDELECLEGLEKCIRTIGFVLSMISSSIGRIFSNVIKTCRPGWPKGHTSLLGWGGRKTLGTSRAVDPGHSQSIGGMGEKWFLLTFMRKKCCVRVKQK